MSHLDHINSEHYYDIEFIDSSGKKRRSKLITNLLNGVDFEQMKKDLTYMFRCGVTNYRYTGSNVSEIK